MEYSTYNQISDFKSKLGEAPLFVCDMDGNIMSGYSLPEGAEPNVSLFPGGIKPGNQDIPFTYLPEELDYFVPNQQILRGIFAGNTMDVRIPKKLVDIINESNANGQPFRLALLTSRKIEEAIQILKASGVKEPEKVTLVGDSGATIQINGELKNARPLSKQEQGVKESIETVVNSAGFVDGMNEIMATYLDEFEPPYIEVKNIAVNVHYRKVVEQLEAAGREDDASSLDKALSTYVNETLESIVEGTSFELRTGAMTVETIIKDTNKGHGLEAIVQAAVDGGHQPSEVIFSGDDICNYKNGGYGTGTDYYAMAAAPVLQRQFGIPFLNTHTHHPENEKSPYPRPKHESDPSNLPVEFPAPKVDLRLPYPWHNAQMISEVLNPKQPKPEIVVGHGAYDVP